MQPIDEDLVPVEKTPKTVVQLNKWEDYAYHILEKHPASERVIWAKLVLTEAKLPLRKNGKKPENPEEKPLGELEEIQLIPKEKPVEKPPVDPAVLELLKKLGQYAQENNLSLTKKENPQPKKGLWARLRNK